jgi:hypothetical protein
MNHKGHKGYKGSLLVLGVVLVMLLIGSVDMRAQQPTGRGQASSSAAAPATESARARAPVDLTGYWVSVVTEDWRFRMVTPPKGDYASLPLNSEGRRVANMWDKAKDGLCEAYGAAAIMRMPGRLHITWQDDNTLKIETDAGQQTRLLRFGAPAPPGGERTAQGYSIAQWGQTGGVFGGGFGGNVAAPEAPGDRGAAGQAGADGRGRGAAVPASPAAAPPAAGTAPGRGAPPSRWAPLKVVTTQLRPGWLRKNGAPYSENTTLTENFIRFSDDETEWFTVVTTVEDPTYLNQSFITSSNFKREPDGSKWKATPCRN